MAHVLLWSFSPSCNLSCVLKLSRIFSVVETEMQERKHGYCRDVNASFLLVADVGFKFLLESSKLQHTVKIELGTNVRIR